MLPGRYSIAVVDLKAGVKPSNIDTDEFVRLSRCGPER
jgi:hypothetical protein